MNSKTDLTELTLALLTLEDAEQLLIFESENKSWFEQFIPPREQDFYSLDGVKAHIQEFLLEYKCRQLLPLLIKDNNQTIVGRLNFSNLDFKKKSAHVGYRVGQRFVSQGVATRALERGKVILNAQGVERLFAYAEVENKASQKVLLSNGFTKVRVVKDYAKLNGSMIDCIEFTLKTD
ncbi:GCN5-like N-acetyltransferase [Vibrio orientalis CIP 102891 = ATCC 33934]|uniref:Acetyltransferase n=1 Tax=Vibrio orientalis CIP 102891 = ATCC 33934 TaxID=675816 RepID=C9QDW7_VIBOR|nr:GNAT family protein [Vibrio orientalis]EEX94107.1 acetyltransferase [Vibrio orientalis CIP 102891 = ATCC 33934]EGU44579.1 GCN5-like N-acetyltransferase [Vibrio orientalis CIP 102891 = ATCC 33934]